MDRKDAKRLAESFMGKPPSYDFAKDEPQKILPLGGMIKELSRLSDSRFGMYAWSREPLKQKFNHEQKQQYIQQAIQCGKEEAVCLKEQYGTSDPDIITREMGLKVSCPEVPAGGGYVILAQYVESDEVTIFMDAVHKAEMQIKEERLKELLEHVDIRRLLLAHEIFHRVEYERRDVIFTKTEKVELWRKPFSNRSELVCLSEIAGMAFAKELLGISFSPYVMDVLLMYGYHQEAATALYEEIMEVAAETIQ